MNLHHHFGCKFTRVDIFCVCKLAIFNVNEFFCFLFLFFFRRAKRRYSTHKFMKCIVLETRCIRTCKEKDNWKSWLNKFLQSCVKKVGWRNAITGEFKRASNILTHMKCTANKNTKTAFSFQSFSTFKMSQRQPFGMLPSYSKRQKKQKQKSI